jgi:hypothetical protein
VADQAARTRAEAIEGFAAVLRDLRESVGNPAFREMSGRSRAISHTTLHEAAQGNRLPSWATTVEFVKACGADPGDYRERWEQADRAVRSASSAGPTSAVGAPIAVDPEPTAAGSAAAAEPAAADDQVSGVRAPWTRRRLRHAVLGVVAVGVVAALGVTIGLALQPSGNSHGSSAPPVAAQVTPTHCPVHPTNPPAAPPAHRGDASAFVADVTLPDCSHVHRGQTVTKVWRLKNIGTVTWTGYSLHRVDLPQQRNQCQTISDVPMADTPPGELVDIKVQITAPMTKGFCFVRFKMLDASGNFAFPGSRPVNFQLVVD